MGRSSTPRYRIEFECKGNVVLTACTWGAYRKHLGEPNAKNLAQLCLDKNASFKPGGVNAHCGPTIIIGARIIDQFTGTIKAAIGSCEPY